MIFSAGEFSLTVSGVLLSVALAAMYLCISVVRDYSKAFNAKHVARYMLTALPVAFVLSRGAYCILNVGEFRDNAVEMLYVWRGGYSLLTALAGFIVAAVAYAHFKKLNAAKFLNVITIGLVLFAAIIRLSEGAAACGKPFSSGFPRIFTYADIYETVRHMPSVYEGIFGLCVFTYLAYSFYKTKKPDGLFARGTALYCVCQLPFESLRDGSPMFDTVACLAGLAAVTCVYSFKLIKTGARLRFSLIRAFIALASLAGIALLQSRAANYINLELNCVWLFALSSLAALACLSVISNCEKRSKPSVTRPSRAETAVTKTRRS